MILNDFGGRLNSSDPNSLILSKFDTKLGVRLLKLFIVHRDFLLDFSSVPFLGLALAFLDFLYSLLSQISFFGEFLYLFRNHIFCSDFFFILSGISFSGNIFCLSYQDFPFFETFFDFLQYFCRSSTMGMIHKNFS